MMKRILLVLLLLIPFTASATGLSSSVKRLYVNPKGLVLFTLDKSFSTISSCNTQTSWQFAFDVNNGSGKEMYSMLMAAYMSKQSVTIGYNTDVCYSGFQSLKVDWLYLEEK
jgi:hypothetical protein